MQVTSEERLTAARRPSLDLRRRQLPAARHRPGAARGAISPILLTLDAGNPNGAAIRFLVEGADLPADPRAYERIVILFDGNDDRTRSRIAREPMAGVKDAGHEATYWQQDERGRWERKA